MVIYLLRKNQIISLKLPTIIQGNYWLSYKDDEGSEVNLVNIEASNNQWIVKSNEEASVYLDGVFKQNIILKTNLLYKVKTIKEVMLIYCMPLFDTSFKSFKPLNSELTIGKTAQNAIMYNYSLLDDVHVKIVNTNNNWTVTNINPDNIIYVNKERINQKQLIAGDSIFIYGLRIIFMGDFFIINNPNNLVKINERLALKSSDVIETIDANFQENPYIINHLETDYFEKSPRFISGFERKKVVIDPPPTKQEDTSMPMLFTIGPMMTMGMVSMVTGFNAISSILNGKSSIEDQLPTLLIALAMAMTMILWPALSSRYQKKQMKIKEAERQEKYKDYLIKKSEEIEILMNREKQVLIENNPPISECQSIILNRQKNFLWTKEIYHPDFLTIRLGLGKIKPNIEIVHPEEHFSMVEDNLKELLNTTVDRKEYIEDVPVLISLVNKKISAVIGSKELTDKFLQSILLQIMTYQSYRDVKIVFLTSNDNQQFEYLKTSMHLFSDAMDIRFYGDNPDDIKQISNYLTNVFNHRKYKDDEEINNLDYKSYPPYYLIIADNNNVTKNTSIIKNLLNEDINYGFSILFISDKLSSIPNECTTFITVSGENGKNSGMFENELISEKQQLFEAELKMLDLIDMPKCISVLSEIPLRKNSSVKQIPKTLSFLEMYNVGNVKQLNTPFRWQENDPTISLNAPVGIDQDGEILKLDIHEKSHGPHGLIAGMTGSGKSEFIITYILSLAINYHPNEVSFVLIDYKGGGLAGAFENRETGIKLPHLAGTITNLDTVEMNRALSSIRSELRRRQQLFNEARDKLGESTIDIYKYQRYYRDGLVDKPISHLLIISDEFAELKTQQPEFMSELISTARIGRSLGVHLILATQKPSGIVDDQIWSNSKFKVCLKVQDKADSRDMIGTSDAASIVDVGRFYLQVGYNEYLALGQSAWCGAKYIPQEKRLKKVDTDLTFIDNIGNVIKKIGNKATNSVKPSGEELTSIVKYLVDIANENNIKIDKLWLNKIPNNIYIKDLQNKYNYTVIKNEINPIIGEYDDPNNQRQGLLTLPLSKDGNTIIYGNAASGKEDLLSTIIYSTITTHSSNEVDFYILDFGTGLLNAFSKAPQVGDVVFPYEEEKVTNLFKMLNQMILARKEILSKFNGDIKLYNNKSQNPLPTIIVIINNYEVFAENYEECNEQLNSLSRDCSKYGIIIILTASATNSVRYKLSQNFSRLIPLQLNDKYDYTTIIGKTNTYPSDSIGRGLIRLDEIYEFQTAWAVERENQIDFFEQISIELSQKSETKAMEIPILPEKITYNMLESRVGNLIPVGIYKDTLEIAGFNFKDNYTTIISAIDPDVFAPFIKPLSKLISLKNNIIVADTYGILNKSENYYTSHFDELVESLHTKTMEQYEKYKNNGYDINAVEDKDLTVIIVGFGTFYSRLSSDKVKLLEEMISKGKEMKKINYVLIDTPDAFRAHEYETWYKGSITTNAGIWIGNGINEQMAIKLIKMLKIKKNVPQNFGYLISHGTAKEIKLLEDD